MTEEQIIKKIAALLEQEYKHSDGKIQGFDMLMVSVGYLSACIDFGIPQSVTVSVMEKLEDIMKNKYPEAFGHFKSPFFEKEDIDRLTN